MFSRTFAYLSAGRLGGDGFFHNSIQSVWVMSVFYTSIYYVVGMAVFVLFAVIFSVLRDRLAPKRNERNVAWLYLVIPFAFYAFVVIDPRTHIYTFFPGAAILAGMVLVALWDRVRAASPKLVYAGVVVVGCWYVLCTGYIVLAFVSHRPEFKREWPESRHALYPVPLTELPLFGYFGFPYRAGWKAIEGLYAQGVLRGTYASNEEPEVTTWYVRGGQRAVPRTMCGQPDNYIVAVNVQDEIAIDWGELGRDYALAVQVMVLDQPKLAVYQRKSLAMEPRVVDVTDFEVAFDATATVDAQVLVPYDGTHPVGADFGDVGRLLGYDVSAAQVQPGGVLHLTLYWQALSSPGFNYQVFAHVVAEGDIVAQDDGAPACAFAPTSLWEQGEFVRDEHSIYIPPDAELGHAQVYVGMYDLLTFDRLPVSEMPDQMLPLLEVEILDKP
jgi:biotin transporter BioY